MLIVWLEFLFSNFPYCDLRSSHPVPLCLPETTEQHSFSLISSNYEYGFLQSCCLCSKSLLFEIKHPQFLHSVFVSSELGVLSSWYTEPSTLAEQLPSYRRAFLFMDLNLAVLCSVSFLIYTQLWSIWRCFSVSHNCLTCHSSHCVCKESYYFL